MKIGLFDADKTNYPNLALMKLSAWHKKRGDSVEWFNPLFPCYKVYVSKVFTYTPSESFFGNIEYGGSGYSTSKNLPEEIEHICPDYSLYGIDYSMGFLTRGCPNKCGWCIVPKKEGSIKGHADIEEFTRHKNVVLMDNNVLAHEHGIKQIEKIAKIGLRVDFNQGLDSRLIDDATAKLLSQVRWLSPIRLACDQDSSMPVIEKAVGLLRKHGATPKAYFCYVLVKDIPSAHNRVEFLRKLGVDPFAQPYRDFTTNQEPSKEQKRFARWVNHKAIFKTVKWENYT